MGKHWNLKYISNKSNATPSERLDMAKVKAASFKSRGYETKIKRMKDGNKIIYYLYIR